MKLGTRNKGFTRPPSSISFAPLGDSWKSTTSLQLLPNNSVTIDPITNQPFQYERASVDQATLQLSDHRGGVRQIWKISVQQDHEK